MEGNLGRGKNVASSPPVEEYPKGGGGLDSQFIAGDVNRFFTVFCIAFGNMVLYNFRELLEKRRNHEKSYVGTVCRFDIGRLHRFLQIW